MFPATAPSVEVFQPSNRDHFTLGNQLKKLVIVTVTWLVETVAEMNSSGDSSFLFLSILTDFISRQWNRVTDESMGTPAKSRDSWFKPRGTIKNIHATLNIWIPQSKYATSECILADWSCFWVRVLWSGPATFRRLPAEKRSFYQQWSWIASQTTQAHTLSRTLRGSSSPTPPVERSGFFTWVKSNSDIPNIPHNLWLFHRGWWSLRSDLQHISVPKSWWSCFSPHRPLDTVNPPQPWSTGSWCR